jgi:hypothetical protein
VLDVEVSVGNSTSAATPADQVTFNGPDVARVAPTTVSLAAKPGPSFTISGSGFTGATSVGFYIPGGNGGLTNTIRIFHLDPSEYVVSTDGKTITTGPISHAQIQAILQSSMTLQKSYTLDVGVSAGAITSNVLGDGVTVTFS